MKKLILLLLFMFLSAAAQDNDVFIYQPDDSLILVPSVEIPEDSSQWDYMLQDKSNITIFNDKYIFVYYDYGDSTEVQFELYCLCDTDKAKYKKKMKWYSAAFGFIGTTIALTIYGILR